MPPGRFDAAQEATAAHLTMTRPGWLVIYGKWGRRFYGIPYAKGVAHPVEAPSVGDLHLAMIEAEFQGSR
ncbi:hypothetical protein ACOZ38_29505 [Sphaerisporangium viridialbum]|uniref:hypothetical protein n=1 Tax=Sphaerisporangium viridialbum TaxID=46189 RepID=UPI003C7919FC